MRYLFLLLGSIMTLGGLGMAQVSCNDFKLSAEIVNRKLEFSVVSDLPDDALFFVTIEQRYWRRAESGVHVFEYFAQEMTMKALRVKSRIDLSDKRRKELVDDINQKRRGLGRSSMRVKSLEKKIKLRVALTMAQKNEDFGQYNKKLEGRAVRQIDAYRGVLAVRHLDIGVAKKKDKPAPRQIPVNASKFEDGHAYFLRQDVALFSHFTKNATQDRIQVGVAPKYGLAFIHQRKKVGEEVWFRVAVLCRPEADDMVMGWAEKQTFGRKKSRQGDAQGLLERLKKKNWNYSFREKPRYQVRGEVHRDPHFKDSLVIQGVITLQDGLSAEDAKRECCRAAWELLEVHGAKSAILKVARQGDEDAKSGGAWVIPEKVTLPEALTPADVDTGEFLNLKANAAILPAYFVQRPKPIAVGTEIMVKKEGSFEVHVHAAPTWNDGEKALARVAKGTMGVIQKVRYLDVGTKTILRYQVKLEGEVVGWVPSEVVVKF